MVLPIACRSFAIPAQYPYNNRMAEKKQHTPPVPPKTEAGKAKASLRLSILKQMLTLATSGFSLVAALAWNSAIQELVASYIKPFLPQGSGLISLLVYAVLVTVIAVTVTMNLSRVIEKLEN